jgi:glycosyltransferase involved in cell wall biosynthesis
MSVKDIIIVTANFPFLPGEQFLETEISFWGKRPGLSVTVLPLSMGDSNGRYLPDNVKIDLRLARREILKKSASPVNILKAVFSKHLAHELGGSMLKDPLRVPYALSSISKIQLYKEAFRPIVEELRRPGETLIYCYWHNEACYALQELKSDFGYKLVSRSHRHDLYSYCRQRSYMPAKRRYTTNLDALYVLCESAANYAIQEYAFPPGHVRVSALGTNDPGLVARSSGDGKLRLVSCSYIVEVKNIRLIIDLLLKLSRETDLDIHWTHIGDGPLYAQISDYARSKLSHASRIDYQFLGELSNHQVFDFYRENAVDLFINVSRSEGQPVSIMEAMSCSIPIIAADVGGISEMIDDQVNGILLARDPSAGEILDKLHRVNFLKDPSYRRASYRLYNERFRADLNYPRFIESVINA